MKVLFLVCKFIKSVGFFIIRHTLKTQEELCDVVYYNRKKFVDVTGMYDIDSQEDFMRFAMDHYGELGLSRLNIFASNDRQQGWKIVVSNSYSANAGLAIEVATTLYKVGPPQLIYDAEKLLRILLEEDYVRVGSRLISQLYGLSGRRLRLRTAMGIRVF